MLNATQSAELQTVEASGEKLDLYYSLGKLHRI